jgi:pterin-4a-carbinolamine dehydratase
VRSLETKDYRGAVALLESQVPLVEQLDHHPVATVGYCELRLEVWTHDQAAVTRLDLEYAQGFEELIKRYAHLLS